MKYTIIFSVVSLIYSIILIVIFNLKRYIRTKENKIYSILLLVNFLGLILEILECFSISCNISWLIIPSLKLYQLYLIDWLSLLLWYTYIICYNNNKKNIKLYYWFVVFVLNLLTLFFPTYLYKESSVVYSYGPSINLVGLISALEILTLFIILFINRKKVGKKKAIPLLAFAFLGFTILIINKIFPGLLLITCGETIVVFIMYFTIENPDVQMLEQVSIAKEAAEKANHAKTDFLSNMSHEIRTPLNAIVGFSESLKDDELNSDAKEKVDNIIMASNNLLEIVNGILDISKIEANKLEIINKEYDIHSMLDELVALTKARIGDKGLDFRVNLDPSIPNVLYGDSARLKQVVLNLLTNAVKYTKEGYIDFTVSSVIKDNVCRLIMSVEDSGIGIKEESIPKLFSKFERLEVEKQMTIEGTGLGLAITKKLIDLMNGKIVVQSVYGQGSKFTVSIDQRIISIEKPVDKMPAKTETKHIDANGARILVVDDNDLNIKVASVLLKKYNFNIDSCTSGLECISKIKNNEIYDIILLDDMMPRMSGRETLQKLKQIADFDTPVIALTANAITGMKEEYLSLGFDDYLSKPIEKVELENVIKKYLNKINKKLANSEMSIKTKSVLGDDYLDITDKVEKIVKDDMLNNNDIPKKKKKKKKKKSAEEKDALKKVLIVDDNEINIKVAISNLKDKKIDIVTVNSGPACIEEVIMNKYDLILLDEEMPEMSGITTLESLKTIEGFKVPVVLMSSRKREDIKDIVEKNGFNDFVIKPFSKDSLDRIIEEFLNL